LSKETRMQGTRSCTKIIGCGIQCTIHQ
jgi:hypothetical protein